jgi:hypothetical protein
MNNSDPNAVGLVAFRKRRRHYTMELIRRCYAEHGECRIADLGGEWWYWRIFDREFLDRHKVRIDLINPYEPDASEIDAKLFTVSLRDACELDDIPDYSFHLVHSNSVIEHVGDWPRVSKFARHARRLARRYIVQTPNYWFPLEPHFGMAPLLHWLPEPLRIGLMLRRKLGPIAVSDLGEAMMKSQSARLLSYRAFAFLFPDAMILRERVFGLTKSFLAARGLKNLL